MPTYRSISIKLHSQFDIEPFPEYIPRSRDYYIARGIPTPAETPLFDDEANSTCSVYVPVFANSQFWLSYAVHPPVPEDQYFLFKLYINGAHIISWSTDKDDKWKGKTMFALFEGEDDQGRMRVEKRVLCFAAPAAQDGKWDDVIGCFDERACLEVRVHRALGRSRVERQVKEYRMTEHGKNERGISLVNAGHAGSDQPKRFYKLALVDPVDKPFAKFRYYYRTWTQLRLMGLSEDDIVEDGEPNELSVIEPCGTDGSQSEEADSRDLAQQDVRDGMPSSHGGADDTPSRFMDTHAPTSPAKSHTLSRTHPDEQGQATSGISFGRGISSHRLSVPPAFRFDPPEHPEQGPRLVPQKRDTMADTSYQPHPVYPINDWELKTPSPIQSLRDTISTPTLGNGGATKRALTPTGWLNAVAGAWRRRATSSDPSSDDGGRTASRNYSRGVH